MGSVVVDFILSNLSFDKLGHFVIYAVPIVLLVILNPIFIKCRFTPTSDDVNTLKIVQNIVVTVSTLYCIIIKSLIFTDDITGSKK